MTCLKSPRRWVRAAIQICSPGLGCSFAASSIPHTLISLHAAYITYLLSNSWSPVSQARGFSIWIESSTGHWGGKQQSAKWRQPLVSGISEEERLPLPRPRSRALSLPGGCRLPPQPDGAELLLHVLLIALPAFLFSR